MTHATDTPPPDLGAATLEQRRDEIRTKVALLHILRTNSAAADAVAETREAELLATMALESGVARSAADLVLSAERELKALAIDFYRLDPSSKQVAPGVSIAVRVGVLIDPAEAERWTLAHDLFRVPSSVDLKALEKFAVGSIPADLAATVTETPTVRLAANLGAALAETP